MIVFLHGGGFVTGSIDTHDDFCRLLALGSGARVVSLDYGLAPEIRFPAQVEDGRAAFESARRLAATLGCDPSRLGIAGDSSGGNLAAAVGTALAGDGVPPTCQLLVYPWLDLRLGEPSVEEYGDGFGLDVGELRWFRDQWLGDAGPSVVATASPAMTEDLGRLAPTHLVVAGFDPLRDEAEAYARRLRAAGVLVTVQRHPGLTHGFVEFLGVSKAARRAVGDMAAAVGRLL
jgi:acetyl esterase